MTCFPACQPRWLHLWPMNRKSELPGAAGLKPAVRRLAAQPGKAFSSISTKLNGVSPALTTLCSAPGGRS